MLKIKGIRLLKELTKYAAILVVAGVVGYLAGHWGTSGSWATAQDCVKEMSDPAYARAISYRRFSVSLKPLCEAEIKRPHDVPERVSRMLDRIESTYELRELGDRIAGVERKVGCYPRGCY